jgi:hypothetical protein
MVFSNDSLKIGGRFSPGAASTAGLHEKLFTVSYNPV